MLGEEEVDAGFFEGGAEAEDEGELAFVEVVAILFEGGEEVVAGDGAKVEVAHRLLSEALEDLHADFVVGGVHDDRVFGTGGWVAAGPISLREIVHGVPNQRRRAWYARSSISATFAMATSGGTAER
jgi:hypothetical protein